MKTPSQDILLIEDDPSEARDFNHRMGALRDGAPAIKFPLEQADSKAAGNLPFAILINRESPKGFKHLVKSI